MPGIFRHFAINADDVERARAFYEAVFGWTYNPWGPPGFYNTHDAGDGVVGALQQRVDWGDRRMHCFMPTIGVDDIRAAMVQIEAQGGRILLQPYRIDGVGEIGYFEDTEGNICGIAQYEPGRFG